MRFLALLMAIALPLSAATRYVDPSATGLNNGTSWQNAWTNLLYLHRLSNNVVAGDVVNFSSGTYTNTFQDQNTCGFLELKGGTSSAWVNYNFTNGPTHIFFGLKLYGYTHITGAKDTNYAKDFVGTYDTLRITNNINLWIDRQTNWYGCGSKGRSIFVSASPAIVEWVRMTGPTNRDGSIDGGKSDSSIECYWGNADRPLTFQYLYIDRSGHHGSSQSMGGADPPKYDWGHIKIHRCLIERFQSDVIHPTVGMDIDQTIIRFRANDDDIGGDGNCNDTFVITPTVDKLRIHHNLIEPDQNVLAYFNPRRTNVANFLFYANVMTPVRPQDQGSSPMGGWFQIEQDIPDGDSYWVRSNVYFLNNTWVFSTNGGQNRSIGFITKDGLNADWRFQDNSFWFKNNLLANVDSAQWSTASKQWSATFFPYNGDNEYGTNEEGRGFIYDTSDVIVDYNLFVSKVPNNINALTWGSKGNPKQWLTNATAIADSLGFTHNLSAVADVLKSPFAYNYTPTTNLVVMGDNLSALSVIAPGIDRDIYWNKRPEIGPWSVGAIEYGSSPPPPVTNSLKLWLTFDDDFEEQGYARDFSGNKADMLRYGWMPFITNYPTATEGINGSQAAAFVPFYDSHPWTNQYKIGQYGAVTNLGALDNLTQATFAVWFKPAWIDPALRGRDQNGTIMDAGYGIPGGWGFRRDYANDFGQMSFLVVTNNKGITQTFGTSFPKGPKYFWYTNNIWWHQAVTVDCGNGTNLTVKLYTNGVCTITNKLTLAPSNAVYFLQAGDPRGSAYGPWISVGSWTHNGTPPLQDADKQPNNGWLNGTLDDIRIYNRVLTDAEIAQIAGGTSPEPPDPPDPPDPPNPEPPSIVIQPQSITRKFKESASFSVTADGPNLAYQWFKNGVSISGATSRTYVIDRCEPGDAGNYNVTVSNTDGQAMSSLATLTVLKKGGG